MSENVVATVFPVLRKAASDTICMYLCPQTLYIGNLNPRKQRNHVKMVLYKMFSMHGAIVEIHVPQQYTEDGFAFVAFAKPSEARKARAALHGNFLFGRRMNIRFAHRESQALLFNNRMPQVYWPVGLPFFRDEVSPEFCLCIRGYPREAMPMVCVRIMRLMKVFDGSRIAHVGPRKTFVEFNKYSQILIACKTLDGVIVNKKNILFTCITSVANIKAAYQGDTKF